MVLPWMEFYTIRTRYSPRHRFKHWLSIQKEYVIDISCTNCFKNRWNYTGVPKDGNRRVGSPTSRFAYMIWRIVSVIRCPCITFNSVRRRIYMLGGHVGLDDYWPICEVGVHLFFHYFNSRSCTLYIKGITKKILGIVLKWRYQANGLLQ